MFKLTKFILSLVVTCAFAACSSQDDIKFSCDPNADAWVKEHLTDIKTMSRTEWSNVNFYLAQSVYRAFTPQQRIQFWKEKISQTLELDWTVDEKEHISLLNNFLEQNQYLFYEDKLSEEDEDMLNLFFYNWASSANEIFGWSKDLCFAIAASGYSLKSTDGELILPVMSQPQFLSNNEPNCDCNQNDSWCTPKPSSCKPGNCTEPSQGCGWFLLRDCDGLCNPGD